MKPGFIARQGRHPSGLLGQIVARVMSRETRAENLIALDLLKLERDDHLLEVGFGHGATLRTAAERVTGGRLAGVDPSAVMLALARRRNARWITAGRMELKSGSSDALAFADDSFSKALSVHTIYFWPRPQRDLAELRRVIAPGGRLVLGYRPAEDPGFRDAFPAEIYDIRSKADIEAVVRQAGFDVVTTVVRRIGGRQLCFTIGS